MAEKTPIRVGILTVSDKCAANLQEDRSGEALHKFIDDDQIIPGKVLLQKCVPDNLEQIKTTLTQWSDAEKIDLILTTGGTGFSDTDVTPEATRAVIEKEAPALANAVSILSVPSTPLALLSRAVCGIRGKTLILNLPGSVKGSTESLIQAHKVIPHAVDQLRGDSAKVARTHSQIENHLAALLPHHRSKVDISDVAKRHRHSPFPMIPVSDAQKIVLDYAKPLPTKVFHLHEGRKYSDVLGYVLAKPVAASTPLPPFPASVKDGYAVIAADGAGSRQIQGAVVAGHAEAAVLEPGLCVRISTGGAVPPGADAVVQVEDTELLKSTEDGKEELEIRILKAPVVGQDIRPVGVDIQAGEVILSPGTRLGPAEMGLLAACNILQLEVFARPVTAVLSTGDELVEPGCLLAPGHIWDSNKTTLLCLLHQHDFPTRDAGLAKDQPDSTRMKLEEALDSADVVVTTGGCSMGEKDILRKILETDFKADIHFCRVFMKPGKPTMFASLEYKGATKLVFALPGNPVSAIVTSLLYVVPALKKMSGHSNCLPTVMTAKLWKSVKLDPRPEYLRAWLEWKEGEELPTAVSTGGQASSRLLSMSKACVLLALPPRSQEQEAIPAGASVKALVIAPL